VSKPEQYDSQINSILREAFDMPEEERDQYIDEACGGDEALAHKVRKMIETGLKEDDDGWDVGFAQKGLLWGRLMADLAEPQSPRSLLSVPAGARIGPFTIVKQIGRGGMGEVYLATASDSPDGQELALKIMSPGLSERLLPRFERERQILATLDHPAIARHVGGGVTDDGRAYIAMEYIDGLAVDLHCDQQRLPVEQRLRLFIDIARAVQYAHRCMIVHRDLKPSNILVTKSDRVKLVDFGIAKLLDPVAGLAAEPLTRTGLQVMTPEYASPEQVVGGMVTAASDVYQLGVVLYELLTGSRPHRLTGSTSAEIERTICEQEPVAPSQAVVTGEASLEEVAAARLTRPDRLVSQLKGDLDNIVLMALRKEPERRYQSVEQLIRDIERHLAGHPISARPDTVAYRLVKFIRRHPIGLTASTVILALVLSFAGYLVQQRHHRVQQDAARAEQVAAFLEGLFDVAEPVPGVGETISAKDLLDRGAERISTDLSLQPQLQATLMGLLGDMYRKVGAYEPARQLLEQALTMRQQELGDAHAEVAESQSRLGLLYTDIGRFDEAELLYSQALQIQESSFGERSLEVAHTRVNLANLYLSIGMHDEAEPLLQDALATMKSRLGDDHEEVAAVLTDLSSLYWALGRYDEAEPLLLLAIEIFESSPNRDRELAIALSDLGQLHARRGQYDEAERLLQRGYEVLEQKLGPKHPESAMSMKAIANLLVDQSRYDEAEPIFQQVLDTLRSAYLGDHPQIGETLNDMALLHWSQGDYETTERLLRQALVIAERTLGAAHPDVAAVLNSLGALYWRQGRLSDAEAAYRRSLQVLEQSLGGDHPHAAVVLANLASVIGALGRHDQATALSERALVINEEAFGAEHPDVAASRCALASLHAECGAFDAAEQELEQALQVQESTFGDSHVDVAATLKLLCSVRYNQGRAEEALSLCQRALQIEKALLGPDHIDVADSLVRLAMAHNRMGGYQEAATQLQQAVTIVERSLGAKSPDLLPVLTQLARATAGQGQAAQAEGLYRRAIDAANIDDTTLKQELDVAEAYLGLGDLLGSLGRTGEARQCWQTALEMTESRIETVCAVRWLRTHGRLLLRLGRSDEAVSMIENLLATGYADQELQEWLGLKRD
jgi:serine/threonine-protein kinase